MDEQRWRQAVEGGAFGVWDLDPRLDTVRCSAAWKARLGFPRIHAADNTAFWRCRVHPEDLEAMLSALRAHLDGQATTYEARFRLRSTGAGYRTILSRGRVVARDERGVATRMVGTMVDLTGWPSVVRPHGLALEGPSRFGDLPPAPQLPFVELVGDLLDRAWHESATSA